MTANFNPIYTLTPVNTWALITTASTDANGTGANDNLVFTAGTNGAFINKLIFQPLSTSGSPTMSAAAARIYINNGSTAGTAANNVLIKETSLQSLGVSLTATVAAVGPEFPLNIQLPSGYTILVGITVIAANTQWNVCAIGGNY